MNDDIPSQYPNVPAELSQLVLHGFEASSPKRGRSREYGQVTKTLARLRQLRDELNAQLYSHPTERPSIHSPTDAFDILNCFLSNLDHEELWILLLDTRNRVKHIVKLYQGSVNMSQVRVSEVFRQAIIDNSPSIIVCHNHPSGDPTPSPVIWRICQGYWPNSATGSQRSGVKRLSRESLHAGDYLPSGHPVKGASLRSASLRDFALDRGPTCGKAFRLGSDSFKKTLVFMNWLTTHHSLPFQNRDVRNSQKRWFVLQEGFENRAGASGKEPHWPSAAYSR